MDTVVCCDYLISKQALPSKIRASPFTGGSQTVRNFKEKGFSSPLRNLKEEEMD